MDASQVVEFLSAEVPLFEDFPRQRLEEIVEGSRLLTFEENEAVIEFGQEGRCLLVLLEGEAIASVTDDGGETHRIGTLGPGDVFGEMSLMTGDRAMADVIGRTRCSALSIPEGLFSTAVISHPPAIRRLAKTISDRLKAPERERRSLAASALRRSEDPYGFTLRGGEAGKVLVVNCGSSSLKYCLFDTADEASNARGLIERIGQEGTRHTHRARGRETSRDLPPGDHGDALSAMAELLCSGEEGTLRSPDEISAVGHRVVHGGDRFTGAVLVTEEVVEEIRKLADLAPLHNPVNLAGIRAARRLFPGADHVAVFDTAFHHTLPPYAYLYGLPYEAYERHGIRRYGFHGMSHSYASLKAAEVLGRPYNEMEIVTCHLGNGASVCAVDHGRSVDTSMGFTPAEGLLMGTRCGDVDPAALAYLMRAEGLGPGDLDNLINRESGLKGLSGISNDMREIEEAARVGHHRALLAYKTFCYHVRKYVGAYLAAMGGLDALVFTGGIGEGSAGVRSLACQGLDCMGIRLDEERNRAPGADGAPRVVSADDSAVAVLVVPADEERMIARETLRALGRSHVGEILRAQEPRPVPIEVSAHHVHLSQSHVEALFGPGHVLSEEAELSQPGQFACSEKVNLVGPKGRVERVRVLGPARDETQIEISMTEQFKLGIQPPIRASGDIEDSPGVTLEGPAGSVDLDKGVICALRHIHMAPEDALGFGLHDRDVVRVRVKGPRELTFGDVLVRVHPSFRLAMHIDTDEANAGNIAGGATGAIDGIQSR